MLKITTFNRFWITYFSARYNTIALHLRRKGWSKWLCCWRCSEINALFRFLQCPVIVPFGKKRLLHSLTQLWDSIFSDISILLKLIPITWKLTSGQRKWIFCILLTAKRFIVQHWKDKHIAPAIQWSAELMLPTIYKSITYQ